MECDDDFLPVLAPSFLPFCAWCGFKGKFKCDLGDSYPGTPYLPGIPFEKQESIWFYCDDCDVGQHGIAVERDREAVSPITGWMVYFHKGHFVVEKNHAFKMLGILKKNRMEKLRLRVYAAAVLANDAAHAADRAEKKQELALLRYRRALGLMAKDLGTEK